jgi:hypothetical protein
MIRSAITTLITASSFTYGATEAVHSITSSVQSSVAVYAAAGDILSIDYDTSKNAEANMFKAAQGLQPIVDNLYNGSIENQFAAAEKR